ncbi:MAG: FkbM family methyltransferase [Candidatus Micrarchaeia archaeon]|jgi:FkbM family methyltransferase
MDGNFVPSKSIFFGIAMRLARVLPASAFNWIAQWYIFLNKALAIREPLIKRDALLAYRASLFHEYLKDPDVKRQKLAWMRRFLDKKSMAAVNRLIESYEYVYRNNWLEYGIWFGKPDKRMEREIAQSIGELKVPSCFSLAEEIFYWHCGLRHVPAAARKVENRDFLDCGAFIGDSAFVFSKLYRPRRVYSFEPEGRNFERLRENIGRCGLANVTPLRLGVGKRRGKALMQSCDGSSFIEGSEGVGKKESVGIVDIDSFAQGSGLDVGLIKMDVEGFELNAVKGALKTIKRSKPVLLISVYHTPQDLFEILPLVKKACGKYRFMVRKNVQAAHPMEVMLIAVPG